MFTSMFRPICVSLQQRRCNKTVSYRKRSRVSIRGRQLKIFLTCGLINQGRSQRGGWGLGPLESKEKNLSVSCRSTKYGCVHSKTFKYFCVYTKRSGSGGGRGGCMVSRMEVNQRRTTGSREINV